MLVKLTPSDNKFNIQWFRDENPYLANVAVNVKVFLHGDNPDGIRGTFDRSDSFATSRAFGCENPIKNELNN